MTPLWKDYKKWNLKMELHLKKSYKIQNGGLAVRIFKNKEKNTTLK